MQVQSIIDRHQPAFAASGSQLSLQRAQQSHWVQVDVNPTMAVGQPGRCWHGAVLDWPSCIPKTWGAATCCAHTPCTHHHGDPCSARGYVCLCCHPSVCICPVCVHALLQCLQQLQGPTPLSSRSQGTSRSQAMGGSRPTRRANRWRLARSCGGVGLTLLND